MPLIAGFRWRPQPRLHLLVGIGRPANHRGGEHRSRKVPPSCSEQVRTRLVFGKNRKWAGRDFTTADPETLPNGRWLERRGGRRSHPCQSTAPDTGQAGDALLSILAPQGVIAVEDNQVGGWSHGCWYNCWYLAVTELRCLRVNH